MIDPVHEFCLQRLMMEGSGESLKQQFQLLQEQQQKRLQMRLQRKEEKEQKNKAHTSRSTASATSLTSRTASEFGISDDLDLKVSIVCLCESQAGLVKTTVTKGPMYQ